MQNTYQNKIVDIQSKKPPIFSKLEGGKKFKIEGETFFKAKKLLKTNAFSTCLSENTLKAMLNTQ